MWRKRRKTFRRGGSRKRKVQWLVSPGATAASFTTTGKFFLPLGQINNPLVPQFSRLATQQDVITYLRIVGELRIGLYQDVLYTNSSGLDTVVSYGLCLVKGEYDGAGTWTVNVADIPDPFDGADDPDKWLVKRDIIMSAGNSHAGVVWNPAGAPQENFPDRQVLMSTDDQGPHYSHLDLKPKRRALWEEKLGIIIGIASIPTGYTIFVNEHLRVLTAKWG